LQVNGANPAIIQVGATYTDLGATITGPQADTPPAGGLGVTTYVNGIEMNPVQLDTTQAATDTIAYVATDQSGRTATSTRIVVVGPRTPTKPRPLPPMTRFSHSPQPSPPQRFKQFLDRPRRPPSSEIRDQRPKSYSSLMFG
jgi:hypothetical protein